MSVALITGANVGLGFETARQLALNGYVHVILACRTVAKADSAAAEIYEQLAGSSKTVFHSLALDVSNTEATRKNIRSFIAKSPVEHIDTLVLNAGVITPELTFTPQKYELIWAASVAGHHVLTTELISAKLLADDAHVVMSGSEAARGTFPTTMMGMSLQNYSSSNLDELNKGMYTKFSAEAAYVHAKSYVAWWVAAMARRFPHVTFLAVSPGNTPGTTFLRNSGFMLRTMGTVLTYIGPWMGMSHSLRKGALRYVEAAQFSNEMSGKFFASPDGWLTGELTHVKCDHLLNEELQEKALKLLEKL